MQAIKTCAKAAFTFGLRFLCFQARGSKPLTKYTALSKWSDFQAKCDADNYSHAV